MVYDNENGDVILYSGGSINEGAYETWILHSSPKYLRDGTYTSPIIPLTSDHIWNNLTINATEPNGTKLTVSIMDGDTGLYIPEYRDMEPRQIDISDLTATSIKLRCHLESDGEISPFLDSWKITWKKKIPTPEYLGGIPSNIPVTEDTPEAAILDLSQYFGETRSNDFTYQIESITDDMNINVEINDSYLDVTYLEDNWTGKTDLAVNCTNDYGESVSSDRFSIVVQRVDDAPAWLSDLPTISIDEDGSYTSASSYQDYLIDAENDMLTLSAACDVTNVTVQMSPEGYLTVIPEKDFFGTGTITITASEIYNPTLKTVAFVPLTIDSINDAPTIKLLSPGDGAVYNETSITLSWEAEDIDTPIENITVDLYFGEQKSPALHMSDITGSHAVIGGLKDKTTYYWYLVAKDGDGGEVTGPTTSFSIDTDSEVIPGDTQTDTGSLNVTIETSVDSVVIEQGNESSFVMQITNENEKPVTLTVVTAGDAAPCLSLNNFIVLSAGEWRSETVRIKRTHLLEPGNYTISLVFVSPDGMKYVSIPLWIRENRTTTDGSGSGTGDDDDKPGDSTRTKVVEKGGDYSWLFLVMGLLILIVILLAVMSTITNSKLRSRVNELERTGEKEEVLEGDAYVPKKTSFQPEIDDRTQMPVSPGPYQPPQLPPQLPGQSFEPRVAAFQSPQTVSSQPSTSLPTSQPVSQPLPASASPSVVPAEVPTAAPQPLSFEDMPDILGSISADLTAGVPNAALHESLTTPIDPFVQLPQVGGAVPQEQKMLPENATGAPPPPSG